VGEDKSIHDAEPEGLRFDTEDDALVSEIWLVQKPSCSYSFNTRGSQSEIAGM